MKNKSHNSLKILLQKTIILSLYLAHHVFLFSKNLFSRKTFVIVSKDKIRNYSISPLSQIAFLFFLLWVGNLFAKSIIYSSIIEKKSTEISKLEQSNKKFGEEVASLKTNLQKINNYFINVSNYNSGSSQKLTKKNINRKFSDIFGNNKFGQQDQKIAHKIAGSNLILDNIKAATIKRISDLEKKLSITGISLIQNKAILSKSPYDIENQNIISLNNKNSLKAQGGPFKELINNNINSINDINILDLDNFNIKDEIETLSNLEKFISHIPLIAPIKSYYVSSGFGKRIDPIRNILAKHEGMDFVGNNRAKIISPSPGKVIFAGKFGNYGKALIIDHGYGITTRYGHLSKILVNKGHKIEKGQEIALQGSTGRSTGQHLHYEIRYKNIPLNPKKFLQSGQEILK